MLNYDEMDIVHAVMKNEENNLSRTDVIQNLEFMLANEDEEDFLQHDIIQSTINELRTMSDGEFASLEFDDDDDDTEDME